MGPFVQERRVACGKCDGVGRRFREKDACKRCRGGRTQPDRSAVQIHIKPGMKDGDTVILPKAGDQSLQQPIPSDIPVRLIQKPHETYTRRDTDLYADVTISLVEALCGFHTPLLQSLDGRDIMVRHPAGSIIRPGKQGNPFSVP